MNFGVPPLRVIAQMPLCFFLLTSTEFKMILPSHGNFLKSKSKNDIPAVLHWFLLNMLLLTLVEKR